MNNTMTLEEKLLPYRLYLDDETDSQETGRGCFGAVYLSKLSGADCIVKKVHDILLGKGNHGVAEAEWRTIVGKFVNEIELLSKQRHPNIVQFLGVTGLDSRRDCRDVSLVMEKLELNLEEFITLCKGNITLNVKLSILKDTACGVNHLHSSNVVHRDLTAGNVLLTSGLRAKVADLGVSRIINEHISCQGSLTQAPGAPDYMPPEARAKNPVYGPKLDCFSFGHLSLYLGNEEYPCIYELESGLIKAESEGYQVTKRKEWLDMLGDKHPLYSLIRVCLNDKSQFRWEMKIIVHELDEIMTKHDCKLPSLKEFIDHSNEIRKLQKDNAAVRELAEQYRRRIELHDHSDDIDKLKNENAAIRKNLEEAEDSCRESDRKRLRHDERGRLCFKNMKNDILMLQQKLTNAYITIDSLQDEVLSLKLNSPVTSNLPATLPASHGLHYNYKTSDKIRENVMIDGIDKDIASVADDKMKQRQTRPLQTQEFFEDDDDPSLGPFDPNLTCQGCGQRYHYGEIQKLRHHINEVCVACQYTQKEQKQSSKNEYYDDIDKEIRYYADEIRRQMQPPSTQEILNDDDDPSLGPYDPNLTCQGCGQRYRYGEIQKLRHHINEFCIARQYTQTRYN